MNKITNPAQDGIDSMTAYNNEVKSVESEIDKFKQFVLDSMAEGHYDHFNDPLVFLESALETYIYLKNNEGDTDL